MDLVSVLLTWISLQMAVAPPGPPDVSRVSQQQLVELAYGDHAPPEASVTALYKRATRTVYLSTAWREDDLRDRSTLLHELVHHVQENSELRYPCLAAREADAYHLQARWLREQGQADPYHFLGIDEFTITVYAMCRDE